MEYKINYTINGILEADNLPDVERERLRELINIYEFHAAKNELKDKSYPAEKRQPRYCPSENPS